MQPPRLTGRPPPPRLSVARRTTAPVRPIVSLRSYALNLSRRHHVVRASHRDDPAEAPPVEVPPPPPPVAPVDENPFPTRRDLGLAMIVGGGFWWYEAEKEYGPPVEYLRNESKRAGMEIIRAPSGVKYGIQFVDGADGKRHMMMLDPRGNIYYDTNSISLGLFVVNLNGDLWNAFLNPEKDARTPVQVKYIGNLRDLKQYRLDGVGDVKYGKDGMVYWAFEDSQPLRINPNALVQRDDKGKPIGLGLPGEIDEGTITALVKKKNPLGALFGESGPSTLQRDF